MIKEIRLSNSIYEICKNDPNVIEIMVKLGFDMIRNPAIRNSAGRFMTIPKGAAMKQISMDQIREAFQREGYRLIEEE